MKKRLEMITFMLLLVSGSFGQNYTLVGTVVDSTSNEKLFYATVGLLHAEDSTSVTGTTTNDQGQFTLPNVKQGDYIFKVSYVGYNAYSKNITVSGNEKQIDMGTIGVTSASTTLSGFTIVEKKPVYMVDGEKTLYNVSEDPGVQTGTLSDALQNAPGVEVDVEGNITLRGVSSVEIWINDKPSKLTAENLKTYIQQMPANSIERIEVITNPSAKYSAKGTGGIINLVTNTGIKKNSFISFGVNGSTSPSISPYLSLGYQNKKWSVNLYLGSWISVWKENDTESGVSLRENKRDTMFVENSTENSRSNYYSGNLYFSASCQIDTANEVSMSFGTYPHWGRASSTSTDFRQDYFPNPDTNTYSSGSSRKSSSAGGWAYVDYTHKFNNDGHKITADISGNTWNTPKSYNEFYRNYIEHPLLNKNYKTTGTYRSYSIYASLDYTIPYLKDKGEISMGVAGDYASDMSSNQQDTLVAGSGDYSMDSLRSYASRGTGYEFSTYFTLQHKFGNFTFKTGLRIEYENEGGYLHIFSFPKDNVKTGNWGFFPSLHLSYKTKSMHNFSLSYTRRVSFPRLNDLIPYTLYDYESYSTGNPDLKPTFTNAVEAGWTKYFEKFGDLGLSTYFRNSTGEQNSISDVIYSDVLGRVVSFSKPFNSGASYLTGGNFNVTYRLKAFMNIRFNSGINYSHTETMFRQDQKITTKNLTYNFSLNFWAKLWKVLEIHASTRYSSKSKTVFTETKAGFSVNCGLRADFLKRKISVYLNINDIFNTGKRITTSDNPYYITHSTNKYNSRSISAGITIRFGKMELESHGGGGMQGGGGMPQ